MELYQAQIIYSAEGTKVFYDALVFMMNTIIIDCMLLHQYVETNISSNEEDLMEDTPLLNTLPSHDHDDSLNVIDGLFEPVALESEREYNVNDPHKLLSQILIDNEIDADFEFVDCLKDLRHKEYTLWKKIKIISRFGHIVPFREAMIQYLAQFVCLRYKEEIVGMKSDDKDKIKEIAKKYCLMLMSNVIFTKNSPKGLMKTMKRIIKQSDIKKSKRCIYKMAALILKNVYHISIPFPI